MKTNPRKVLLTLAFLAILVVSVSANAEPVYNPNNGHYYERIDAAVNWYEARDMAEQMTWMGVSGHLATVTTEEENSWIVDNLGGAATLDHWLGAYQEDGSTDHFEGWHWVTGELWDYDFMLAMWWDYPHGPVPPLRGLEYDDDEGTPPTPGKWIGYPLDRAEEGFIVEFEGPYKTDLLHTLVQPCRIVDTRLAGGAIPPSGIRSYNVHGAVASQGGNPAGCPSPTGEPLAVNVNVTVVPLGQGNILAYPFGSTAPNASLVNYKVGVQNIANSGTVKTCFNCLKDINIKSNNGTAHVVIDVLGYYYAKP